MQKINDYEIKLIETEKFIRLIEKNIKDIKHLIFREAFKRYDEHIRKNKKIDESLQNNFQNYMNLNEKIIKEIKEKISKKEQESIKLNYKMTADIKNCNSRITVLKNQFGFIPRKKKMLEDLKKQISATIKNYEKQQKCIEQELEDLKAEISLLGAENRNITNEYLRTVKSLQEERKNEEQLFTKQIKEFNNISSLSDKNNFTFFDQKMILLLIELLDSLVEQKEKYKDLSFMLNIAKGEKNYKRLTKKN